jgi:ABC-2 type transport system permease protein
MRGVLALLIASLRSLFVHKKALFVRASFMMINNALYFVFWYFIFRKTNTLYGWTLNDIYMFLGVHMMFFGVSVSVTSGWKDLKHLINTGAMDVYLLRPMHPMIQALFSRTELSGVGDYLMGAGLFLYASDNPISSLPMLFFISIVGGLASIGGALAIYSFSFWRWADESLLDLFFELSLAISGYPEHILNRSLHFLAFFILPIGLTIYLPVRFVREPSIWGAAAICCGCTFLLLLAKIIFDAGLKRYESGSGWTVHT